MPLLHNRANLQSTRSVHATHPPATSATAIPRDPILLWPPSRAVGVCYNLLPIFAYSNMTRPLLLLVACHPVPHPVDTIDTIDPTVHLKSFGWFCHGCSTKIVVVVVAFAPFLFTVATETVGSRGRYGIYYVIIH